MSRRNNSRNVPRSKRLSRRASARRRGVILLVVLGMLALFTVVVLTFVIVARQHQQASVALAKAKHYDDAYEEHLNQTALQILRGTTNSMSVLGPHSLLEDLYGSGLSSSIADTTQIPTTGGFQANNVAFAMGATGKGGMMYIKLAQAQMKPPGGLSSTGVFESIPGYYVGRILTMTSGAAKGKSARITGYAPVPLDKGPDGVWGTNLGNGDDDGNGTPDDISEQGWPGSDDPWQIRLMPFEGMTQAAGGGWDAAGAPAAGDEFIINGRTFAGTGFGYDPDTFTSTQLLDALNLGPDGVPGSVGDDDMNGTAEDNSERKFAVSATQRSDDAEFALLPNPVLTDYRNYLTLFPINANEDYDAPDYQNMLLALRVADASGVNSVPLPSLHRPDLVNYWYNRLEAVIEQLSPGNFNREQKWQIIHKPYGNDLQRGNGDDPAPTSITDVVMWHKRRFNLRPLQEDHPNFNGSNPASAVANRPATAIDTGTGQPFPYWELTGPWDVDNDGDGVPDSIWVDVGLPVETLPDGRTYKPLMAIMVLDMDGKLNLNFHGQLNDWNNDLANGTPAHSNPAKQLVQLGIPTSTAAKPELAGTWDTSGMTPVTRPATLIPGLGLGPQEVSLSLPVGGSNVLLTEAEFRDLCRGYYGTGTFNAGRRYEGRYGEAYLLPAGNHNNSHDPILAGLTRSTTYPNGDDNYFLRLLGMNNPAYHNQGSYGAYGSPTDFDGNGVLGLTPSGQPQFYYMGTGNGANNHPEVMDDGAEMSAGPDWKVAAPGGLAKVDAKFSPADLEWLLRQQDVDGPALRSRLPDLAPSLATRYGASRATTESWSIPSPSYNPTPEIARGLAELRAAEITRLIGLGATQQQAIQQATINVPTVNLGMVDLIRGKINEVERLGGAALTLAQANARTRKLLRQDAIAPELLLGLRFNVNRPFGNNRDDDNDGIVDEPEESYIASWLSDGVDNDGDGATDEADEPYEKLWNGQAYVDRDGDGRITARDNNGLLNIERQRYAKQLFTLMMLLKDQNFSLDLDPEGVSNAQRLETTAQQIAQWCVNVVDFRDQDSIMTPFEYTIAPFDTYGWNLDGDITTDESTLPAGDPNYNPNRRVVWGCETPTLVLTETLAFHDKRVEDLNNDESNMDRAGGDDDYDSKRIPQGTALLEVQCVRNPNNSYFSQDLFTPGGSLDLGKMAPGGDPSPVWRVAISESSSGSNAANPTANNVAQRLTDYPFSSTLETAPDKFNKIFTTGGQEIDVQVERIVWFSAQKPSGGHPDRDRVYYNRAASGSNVHLRPGHYAVVGPSRTYSTLPTTGNTTKRNVTRVGTNGGTDSPQEIRLTPLFEITDNNSGMSTSYPNSYPYPVAQPTASPSIKEVMGIAVGADRNDYDASWNAATLGPVGFSISEPLFSGSYYPPPDEAPSVADPHDGSMVQDGYTMPKDAPLDSTYLANDRAGGLETGTTAAYKTAFLQRLADPTRPHDPVTNPYRTVDWLPMDLTVFNGSAPKLAAGDPAVDPNNNTGHNVTFRSRQRGDPKTPPAMGGSKFDLWSAVSDFDVANNSAAETGSDVANFPYLLDHTLGFLNEAFHDTTATPPWLDTNNPYQPAATYVGDPRRPFPWLTWNNRPYVNAMELLQVPISSSGRLFWDYSNFDSAAAGEFYSDPVGVAKMGSPFGHLLNFFLSSNQSADYTTIKPNDGTESHTVALSNYFRVFDFVAVPSPFEGTETLLNPAAFGPTAGQEKANWFTDYNENGTHDPGEPWEFAPFYAPNNRLPTYREPGKVNINTISDAQANTWLGITGGFNSGASSDNAVYNNIVLSRQGYAGAVMQPSATLPSVFSNPFRMTGNISHVPIPALRGVNTSGELIDSTLLRRLPNTTGHVDPLLSFDTERSGNPPVYNSPTTEGEFNDAFRNPYFKYQSYQKLGNTLTTQSNVYAMWITIGYFEVERVATTAVHPDGYRLMQEIGSDTGEIKRHRAFYLIDRSIPVAFERGSNHNVHRAILVKRIIE